MQPKEIAFWALGILAGIFLLVLLVLTIKLHGIKKRAEARKNPDEKTQPIFEKKADEKRTSKEENIQTCSSEKRSSDAPKDKE